MGSNDPDPKDINMSEVPMDMLPPNLREILDKTEPSGGPFQGLNHDNKASKLTVRQLACALYEGTPHLQNLAEKLARQHGHAGALTFFDMMGDDVQNFWMGIAKQLIDHAKEWQPNEGSCCVLSNKERQRLKELPRVEED